jgi:hypothetical protein
MKLNGMSRRYGWGVIQSHISNIQNCTSALLPYSNTQTNPVAQATQYTLGCELSGAELFIDRDDNKGFGTRPLIYFAMSSDFETVHTSTQLNSDAGVGGEAVNTMCIKVLDVLKATVKEYADKTLLHMTVKSK